MGIIRRWSFMAKHLNTVVFTIDTWDANYFLEDAKHFIQRAREYGYTAQEFKFHVTPINNGRYIDAFQVEIGEIGTEIRIRSDYIEFKGGYILDSYTVDFININM